MLWRAVQNLIEHRYEKSTGSKADWTAPAFLAWLIQNLPAIIKIVLLILSMA